jgi:hypothetical protein
MADLDDFGIVSITTALTSQFNLKNTLQETPPVLTEDGEFSNAWAFKEEYMFEAQGAGDLPADFALAGAGPTIAGLTGGVTLIDKAGEAQKVGEANGWTAGGEHAPAAE